jgi:hypothetical protein
MNKDKYMKIYESCTDRIMAMIDEMYEQLEDPIAIIGFLESIKYRYMTELDKAIETLD